MMSNNLPLISCVCVTRKKPALLKRAIDCFRSQTYPSKEMIVLYETDDEATAQLVARGFPVDWGIRVIRVPAEPKVALGGLRNMAIEASKGEFICQWDDDDWYHMQRLEDQYEALRDTGRDGSILTQWLLFDSNTGTAYVSNKRLWEGSILCRKSALQLSAYEDKTIGEDSATIEYLSLKNHLFFLNDLARLYIYVYHGSNTWNYNHWTDIFNKSMALAAPDSKVVRDILDGKFSIEEGSRLLDEIFEQSRILMDQPGI